jgi:azurin/glucose/arabinose dehydrogenase
MKMIARIAALFIPMFLHQFALGQVQSQMAREDEYYKIIDVPIPNDIVLEVGGMSMTEDDKLAVSTRRGEVWMIDKPYGTSPVYQRYAHGLHEPLGLAYRDNGFYLSQRGELTRLEDTDADGKADLYKTVYSWPLSGNYHEYSYGPKFLANGDMLVTLNLAWIGRGASLAKWRGWLLQISPDGEMAPIATGLRSPAGFEINEKGDVFYTENQGGWVGSGRLTHLEKGDFAGNPEGLRWTNEPQSPLELRPEDIEKQSGLTLYEYAEKIPDLKVPAIWFPHTILGISTSDILFHSKGEQFGPFENQIFIGDQGHSKIMRVFMEKVNGVYQGAAFPFREGFSSGILRMVWGSDSSMFVGMTSRGWASTGTKSYDLQRLVWTGKTPFEIKTMKVLANGFLLEFTKPLNTKIAADPSKYQITSFNYKYHDTYGSPIINQQKGVVRDAEVAKDGLSVKLTVNGMRLGYIHEIKAPELLSSNGELLLHHTGYYTLNEVPGGKVITEDISSNSSTEETQSKRINEMPDNWNNGPDTKLVIGTVPGLKYDISELVVKASSKIELTFNNNDDMLHNVVVTATGDDSPDKVGEAALRLGLDGAALNYVPDSELVLFHTGIVSPGNSEKIYFNAPSKPGQYWLVCTFPGHHITMRAKFIVQ